MILRGGPMPSWIVILGWLGASLIPAVILLVGGAATYAAQRIRQRFWPNEIDRIHRETQQNARVAVDLYDALSKRTDDLESQLSKIKRSLKHRNLWDSREAPPR